MPCVQTPVSKEKKKKRSKLSFSLSPEAENKQTKMSQFKGNQPEESLSFMG
jgi:hypothetical protein